MCPIVPVPLNYKVDIVARPRLLPLTAEEQAEEQRTAEIEQMENFLLSARFSAGNCADLYGSSRI